MCVSGLSRAIYANCSIDRGGRNFFAECGRFGGGEYFRYTFDRAFLRFFYNWVKAFGHGVRNINSNFALKMCICV